MIRYYILAFSLFQHGAIFAEANLNMGSENKTILLTAPGTLSGVKQRKPLNKTEMDSSQMRAMPFRQRPYKFVDQDYFKFPQYGQVDGLNNPWSKESQTNRQLPPALPPASPYSSNPWDLGGNSFSSGLGQPAQDPYSYRAPHRSSLNGYRRSPTPVYTDPLNRFNPGVGDGIFRDTNPAAIAPFMNGMMPGMGGDNFPFSPFGMF